MKKTEEVMLTALARGLQGLPVDVDPVLSADQWEAVVSLAHEQSILPLVCNAVYHLKSFQELEDSVKKHYQESAVRQTIRQIEQEKDFLTFLLFAQQRGYDPVVLKGMIVRSLYPQPYLRPSVDEDILISPKQARAFHQIFLQYGFKADSPEDDVKKADEFSYHKPESPSYVELHKHLFSTESKVFRDFNGFFENALDRTVQVQIEDVSVRTLAPTDHVIFLILHAYKHFVYSGVGVRALCDIGMFSRAYAEQIDWQRVCDALDSVRALYFAKALFRIIKLYLMPEEQFDVRITAGESINVKPLLADMLASGAHGNSTTTRLHSSNMTLEAVKAKRLRKRSVISSVFPSLKSLRGRYPYLKKAPFLLPIAWAQRIVYYLKETRRTKGGAVGESAQSIRLGRERVKLLEKYHII